MALASFEEGKSSVKSITVEKSNASSSPPKPLLIITPTVGGTYPLLLFFHGFLIQNTSYKKFLQHISSHGFIVVAPQVVRIEFNWMLVNNLGYSGAEEVNSAAEVTNWLSTGLQPVLPENVQADVLKLAVAGHSRGGMAAFALALGRSQTRASLKFSALIGLDPVAGRSIGQQIQPEILTYVPQSFDFPIPIPVAVIGTGLGHKKKGGIFPACAPNGVNHCGFFTECKPPCWSFCAKDYGHLDMLDDPNWIFRLACVSGKGDKDPFKKCLGGIFVAFLRACLNGESEDLKSIVEEPKKAPVTLNPVIHIEE